MTFRNAGGLHAFFAVCVAVSAPLIAAVLTQHTSFASGAFGGWSNGYLIEAGAALILWLALAIAAAQLSRRGQCSIFASALLVSVCGAGVAAAFEPHERAQSDVVLLCLIGACGLTAISEITRVKSYLISSASFLVLLAAILLFEIPTLFEPRNVRSFASWGDAVTFKYLFPGRAPYFGPGGRLTPNLDVSFLQPHWYPKTVRLVTNNDGFRNFGAATSGAVLSLGDSFAIGDGADQEMFFGAVLEKNLTGRRVLSAEVSNLTRGLLYLQEYGPKLKPAVILYGYYGANDLLQDYCDLGFPASRFKIEGGRIRENSAFDAAESQRINDWYAKGGLFIEPIPDQALDATKLSGPGTYTRILELGILRGSIGAAESLGFIPPRSGGELLPSRAIAIELKMQAKGLYESEHFTAMFLSKPPNEIERMYLNLKAELEVARSLATEFGSKLVLVYIPHRFEVQTQDRLAFLSAWGLDSEQFDWDLPPRRIRDIAAAAGVELVDLTPGLREAAQTEQLYFWRDIHWNEKAQEIAAKTVAAALAEGRNG